MKKVCLKFLGTGYNQFCQSKIKIYDLNNSLVFEDYTYNGEVMVQLCENSIYKIVAILRDEITVFVFRVNNMDCYYFIFNSILLTSGTSSESRNFSLTDAFYGNLPIESGEIILWQNR